MKTDCAHPQTPLVSRSITWYICVLLRPSRSGGTFISFLLLKACLVSVWVKQGFLGGSVGKESAWNSGDVGSILGSWRSPGGGNGNPLQYSYLANPMDRGAWLVTVHGVAKNQTWQTWLNTRTHPISETRAGARVRVFVLKQHHYFDMGWDVLIFPNLCSLMYFACIVEEIKCKYCSFSLTIGTIKQTNKKTVKKKGIK